MADRYTVAERSREGPPLTPPAPVACQGHDVFLTSQRAAAAPSAQMRIACSSIAQGRLQLRTIWGTVQEAAALLDVLHAFPRSTVHEVGLCMLDPATWGFHQSELPPVGSSPDALIYHPPCPKCGAGSVDAQHLHDDCVTSDSTGTPGAPASGGAECDCQQGLALPGQWEVVEVKNHCPFVRTAAPGRCVWYVRDDKPRARIPPQYMPQLQLEMLTSGLRSALFVSRSAEHGTNIFRVPRDDAYCALMLQLLSRFHLDYVRVAKVPPKAFALRWPPWRRFCLRTGELAARARLLHHVRGEDVPLGQGQPLFL